MEGAGWRPRILFVGAFPPPRREIFGGMVTSCRALLNSSFSTRAELILVDTTQVSNPPPPLWIRALLAFRRFLDYVVRFERSAPDVTILFTATGASVVDKSAMAWYARLRGVPALIFPRGGALMDVTQRSLLARLATRLAFRGARSVLCQESAWQRFAVESLGLATEDAPIIPNWTATNELLSIGRRRRFGDRDPVRLLFLGWVKKEKGIFDLIEACAQLSPEVPFVLDVVGEGSESAAARELVERKGLDSVVRFHGWLSGDALEERFALADILVQPSWAEGLPNAMIEAMAARLAIIVTAVGNVPDVVTDGREAILIPPRDVPALAAALRLAIGDAPLRRALGDAAFMVAEQRFGVEQAVDRIIGAVKRVAHRENAA
jgi:glycosyltransferase involved in cell wall biosynthesis